MWDAEIRMIIIDGQSQAKSLWAPIWTWLLVPIIPGGGINNRRIVVQGSPSIRQDPISKITRATRAGDMAQVVEHLPRKQVPEFKPYYCQKMHQLPSHVTQPNLVLKNENFHQIFLSNILFYLFIYFIYSHVHTLFGSFLSPPPTPPPPLLASRQNMFCPYL
jgi:hypothetical protein